MEATPLDTRALDLAAPMRHRPFRTAAVLGAGTMGAQIAAHLANAGLDVHLLDIAPDEGDADAVVERGFRAATKAKPDPFFDGAARERVTLGNFRDDFDRVGRVDWIVEAVVERMDVKREVAARIEQAAHEEAVVSTNTSGLPIHEIAEGRSEGFRRRFLGTHFFNPPRYLELLELVPTADTDPAVLARVAQFGRLHLGKGIVVANDVPYFVGNRVGVYGMMQAMRHFLDGDYTIEEIDALTGPLVGRPKSATFRTADVVGLDVLLDVARNLYDKAGGDESREAFRPPALLERLVEQGARGAKTGAGFYKKEDGEIKSIDPDSGRYIGETEKNVGDLDRIRKAGDLPERLRALYADEGRAGRFFRATTLDLLGYAARRVPEITDSPADVDRALRWGFGWTLGPFEMWDALGFETVLDGMEQQHVAVPDWVRAMQRAGHDAFYQGAGSAREVYVPGATAYVTDAPPADEAGLAAVRAEPDRTLWRNEEAALLDLGDGVALYEFQSKANTLGPAVIEGLVEVLDRVERDPDLRGLVIGNEGDNFSVGANLGEVVHAAQAGQFDRLEGYVEAFQGAMQRVRYAEKPVVVAAHGRVLGGGCELTMASAHPVAAAETYIGLVELGVGLIPAGTGTAHLAALAAERVPSEFPSHVQPVLQGFFENVAKAEVATSAVQAKAMGYLPEHAFVVMRGARRLHAAKAEVVRLSEQGYRPPAERRRVFVLGRPTRAAFEVALQQFLEGGFASAYDVRLARDFAYVLTGGDLTAPQHVPEQYLVDLEREIFMRLLGEEKTQQRIMHMLKEGKPLRN